MFSASQLPGSDDDSRKRKRTEANLVDHDQRIDLRRAAETSPSTTSSKPIQENLARDFLGRGNIPSGRFSV